MKTARRSKYTGKRFGNWECIDIVLNNVQGAKAKRPGHRNYKYLFQRLTSDGLADKLVLLNSTEVANVRRGLVSVEEIADSRKANPEANTLRNVIYRFR